MSGLKDLFDYREKTNNETTRKIFHFIEHVTQGIMEFIDDQEDQKEESLGIFSWEDALYLNNEMAFGTNGMLLVIGTFSYNIGSNIILPNGEKIKITEETVNYFKRIIRIGIPFDLAETGSKEEIISFLENTVSQEEREEREEQESKPNVISIDDFNIEGLTESQQQLIKTSSHLGGEKKH